MAKADIELPGGITVHLEGTPAEILSILDKLRGDKGDNGDTSKVTASAKSSRIRKAGTGRVEITDLIEGLIESGYFRQPRDLSSVKGALAEAGHHYPITTLSPTMLRQVRKRNLRRLKKDQRWVYTR